MDEHMFLWAYAQTIKGVAERDWSMGGWTIGLFTGLVIFDSS